VKCAPIPKNEEKRLEALRRFQILESKSEQIFDDITFLASYVCEAPIALISLIDSNRQWFKSRIGIEVTETPRDISFCGHAILDQKTMIVQDTLEDDRFSNNPLVTQNPHIRFYAGAPLMTTGSFALGTLCVIDRRPRSLTDSQQRALEALSRQVSALIEMRNTVLDLKNASEMINALKELLPMCAWCRKIRDDNGNWEVLEMHLKNHSDIRVTHGICPECSERELKLAGLKGSRA